MRSVQVSTWCAAILMMVAAERSGLGADAVRQVIPFDEQWKFSGIQEKDIAGAEAPGFGDGQWRVLNLPHDWSIEAKLDPANKSGPAGAYLPGGIGYYRKRLTLLPGADGKRAFIEFDGIMQDATVRLNGKDLGRRPNGYVTQRYELTGGLTAAGQENVITVKADESVLPAARWYPGAGIYRHVRLILTDPVHVDRDGVSITTPKVEAGGAATVHVETSVVNQSDGAKQSGVQVEIVGPDGKTVQTAEMPAKSIGAGKSETFAVDIVVASPQLWSMETASLYKAVVRVESNGAVVDDTTTSFGIRTTEFKADTGFWINGKNVKLYGVCLHQDGGGIGAAVPMGVWERRLTILKGLGVNAIRTSHNAPDPAFLDLCDRMGMVVMHEMFDVWTVRKVPGDYARYFNDWWERDLTETIKRDRNHPSVVIYSAGNEIHDSQEKQKEILPKLIAVYHKVDPTRPVTQALFRPENPGGAYTNGIAEMLDVVGTNYRPDQLSLYHKQHPQAKVIGTEDNYRLIELSVLRDESALAGTMVWTGVDYLGEGRQPPSISQGFGMVDRIGPVRLRGYERQAWWTDAAKAPMVKMGRVFTGGPRSTNDVGGGRVLDWTPADQEAHEETVEVFSNCERVELFLNDTSLGVKEMPKEVIRTWKVPFAAGTLKAVAKIKGAAVATDELKTAGKSVAVKLTVDQGKLTPAWDDVAYVRAEVVDEKGVVNPNATDKVTFKVDGPGILFAVDNADLDSHEGFRGSERSAYRGVCVAVIKATGAGKITVTASAGALAGGSVSLEAEGRAE